MAHRELQYLYQSVLDYYLEQKRENRPRLTWAECGVRSERKLDVSAFSILDILLPFCQGFF